MTLDTPVLVADPHPTLPVTRRHHPFEFEEPLKRFEEHCSRVMERRRVAYVGPRVVVRCDRPTPGFWRAVYAEKGAWFRTARTYFPRQWLENPTKWSDPTFPGAPFAHLQEHRKACVTGEVLIGSTSVRPKHWPTPEQVGYRPRGHRAQHDKRKVRPEQTEERSADDQTAATDWRLGS